MAFVAEFRLLGPVEAVLDEEPVSLPAAKPRALLALLLLNRNRVVPVPQLIDDLWSEEPPDTATKALQVYVSQLRKAIGPDRVLTKPPGYALRVDEGELDLDEFERLVAEGRERLAAGDAERAAEQLREALELWRGPALAEFRSEPFARDAGARLEESQLAAVEDRIDAELALGRHDRLIGELEELVRRHPFRERLRGQLMLALYRSGRQADALDVYRRTRETLVEELGIEPGPALHELEQAILRQDPDLQAGRRSRVVQQPAAAAAVARPRRRLVVGLAAGVLAALVAAAVAAVAITRGGSSSGGSGDAELRTFVSKVENFLVQSRDDRREVATTVAAAFECKLAPRAAAVRLNRVQRGRQSLLQQIAALSVPDREEALRASDLLQKAAHASITADWHYRDWLAGRKRCGPPDASPDLRAAAAASARATRTKKAFLAVFDPLARRFGRRVWTAGEF
jgi:DNA-binding SARP family transcriptional activator